MTSEMIYKRMINTMIFIFIENIIELIRKIIVFILDNTNVEFRFSFTFIILLLCF